MCIYFIPKKITDLNGEMILKEVELSELKKKTEILVIDDDEFIYLDALRQSEFRIDHRKDIQSLKDVAEYDIILCDIRGVGKILSSQYEGAFLVKQIKEKYPNKIIIAYTASEYDAKFQEFLSYADATIPKGTALEDWDSLLNSKIRELADPVKQWKKTSTALLQAGVSTAMIAKYESDFVKAVKKGRYESLRKIYENSKRQGGEIMLALIKLILKITIG